MNKNKLFLLRRLNTIDNIHEEIYIQNINDKIRFIILELYKKFKNTSNPQNIVNILIEKPFLLSVMYRDYIRVGIVHSHVNSISELKCKISSDHILLDEMFLSTELYYHESFIEKSKLFNVKIPSWLENINPYNILENEIYCTIPNLQYMIDMYQELLDKETCLNTEDKKILDDIEYDEYLLEKDINELEREQLEIELTEMVKVLYNTNYMKYKSLILEILSSSLMLEIYSKKLNNQKNTVIEEFKEMDLHFFLMNLGIENKVDLILRLVKNYFTFHCVVGIDQINEVVSDAEQEIFQKTLKSKIL